MKDSSLLSLGSEINQYLSLTFSQQDSNFWEHAQLSLSFDDEPEFFELDDGPDVELDEEPDVENDYDNDDCACYGESRWSRPFFYY